MKQSRLGLLLVPMVTSVGFLVQFVALPVPGSSAEESATLKPARLAPGGTPPIPEVGRVAQPRSGNQVGFPAQLTRTERSSRQTIQEISAQMSHVKH